MSRKITDTDQMHEMLLDNDFTCFETNEGNIYFNGNMNLEYAVEALAELVDKIGALKVSEILESHVKGLSGKVNQPA